LEGFTQKAATKMSKSKIRSDLGTDERVAGEDYRDEATGLTAGSQLRRRILSQSLIDRYYQRGYIDSKQYNTAQYLLTMYSKGAKSNSMKYDVRVDGGGNSTESINIGFSEFMRMTRKLPSDLFRVIQFVVIEGGTCTSLDEKDYNSRRVSMKLLKRALDSLADYFGIS